MKCPKCGLEVSSSYLKCPSCGAGFHGVSSGSSFDIPKQNSASQLQHQPQPAFNQAKSPLVSSNFELASIGARFGAALIDGLILVVPAVFLGAMVGIWGSIVSDGDSLIAIKSQAVGYLIFILYQAVFLTSSWMATPGKRLLSIKVVDLNGRPISFWRGVGRSAGQFLSSIFLIGYIMAFFTKNKQALHDMMAGTLVIKD